MGCERVRFPPGFFGNAEGAWGYESGPGINPEPLACAICGKPARALCDWPVAKRTFVLAPGVQLGDIFLTIENKYRCEVLHIARDERPLATLYLFRVRDLRPNKRNELYHYERWGTQKVELERPATCDAPCCYRHRRHVGPGRDICATHWASQNELCSAFG